MKELKTEELLQINGGMDAGDLGVLVIGAVNPAAGVVAGTMKFLHDNPAPQRTPVGDASDWY